MQKSQVGNNRPANEGEKNKTTGETHGEEDIICHSIVSQWMKRVLIKSK